MTAFGEPNLCSAQCTVGEGEGWQDVGECLGKRVDVVICKPRQEEIGSVVASSSASGMSSGSVSGSATRSASGSASGSGSAPPSTGGGNVGVVHVNGSKTGVVLFAVLAVGSFAGMML